MAKKSAGSLTTSRRTRVEPTPALDRILRKGARAFESVLDAVAENPEEALQAGGAFVGRVLDTLDAARRSYKEDPDGAKREIKNMVVGALAEQGRKKRKRIR